MVPPYLRERLNTEYSLNTANFNYTFVNISSTNMTEVEINSGDSSLKVFNVSTGSADENARGFYAHLSNSTKDLRV